MKPQDNRHNCIIHALAAIGYRVKPGAIGSRWIQLATETQPLHTRLNGQETGKSAVQRVA